MIGGITPESNLLKARRALDGIPEVKLLDDWKWEDKFEKWYLHFSLTLGLPSGTQIPQTTNWYITVDSLYPLGSIKVYPDINEGIEVTFPHQGFNNEKCKNGLWRKGTLCLDTGVRALGRYGYDYEPYEPDERLAWHILRAIIWVRAASQDKLSLPGEPFELPDFPLESIDILAFSEDIITYMEWESTEYRYGIAELDCHKDKPSIYIVKHFKTIGRKDVKGVQWGQYLSKFIRDTPFLAFWVMLKEVPVIHPWQAPHTFSELNEICSRQNVNLLELLRQSAHCFRDGRPHITIIGFPIPERIGEPYAIIYWQAFKLPVLSFGKQTAKGFRTNEAGRWLRDKTEVLRNNFKLEWMHTQNWNYNDILNRGKLQESVISKSILIIGAGTIGSTLSELLVRAGVCDITIMDGDSLSVGNLSRHTLGIEEVGLNKAFCLEDRLNKIGVHSNVKCITNNFEIDDKVNERLEKFNVILDCTGEDKVLHYLSVLEFKKPKIFASVSVGLGAKRLFLFMTKAKAFECNKFIEAISPWLTLELDEYKDKELPRDGIGCWSPVFPARADDIWIASSTALKVIESFILNPTEEPIVEVFEQCYENGTFIGFKKIKES